MYKNSYIKMGQYKRIAHFVFNGSLIKQISNRFDYVAKLRKVTFINLHNSTRHYIFVGDKFNRINHLLGVAADMNFEVAVVWFEGSWPLSHDFDHELLSLIDGEWNKTNWLSAGHIIDRNKMNHDSPHFHTQCVILNLKTWTDIGKPSVDRGWDSDYPAYEASEQHIHDNYTPLYLSPAAGTIRRDNISISNSPLSILIPHALSNNLVVHNLPYSLREHKHCCYPEDDIKETEQWLLDENWSDKDADELSRFQMEEIDEDKEELYGYKVMKSHVMYITNTESIPGFEKYDVDVMTAPCSGLHQFKHMTNARPSLKRVIWTDFSEAGVWWTKKLLAEWDGLDFHSFYLKHEKYMEENFVAFQASNYDRELAERFVNHYDSLDTWLDHWNWIRSLDHKFMNIDLVKNWQLLVDEVGTGHKVFMQVSNIWQYEVNYLNTPHHQAQASFINLINELLKNNREIYMTGDSPNGIYYSYQNMKEVISIL